jgi:DNA-binding winged helix-turn-helix (wHTH) protein
MNRAATNLHIIRFGAFEVDLRTRELRKNGLKIKLQEQPFQVLAMLLRCPGDVVTREELQKAVWPADTFVDFDRGLNKAINKIREALGDSADNPRFVETLPRRGYRFIAPVDVDAGAGTQWGLRAAALLVMGVVGLGVVWFIWNRSRPQPELKQR